jgi:hypothetical protein
MIRHLQIVGAAAMFLCLAPSLIAHDNYRVVGIISKRIEATKIAKMRIDVFVEGWATVQGIRVDEQTEITRDKDKVGPKELKLGAYVVVDGWGDSYEDLRALAIRIVPPIAPVKPASPAKPAASAKPPTPAR